MKRWVKRTAGGANDGSGTLAPVSPADILRYAEALEYTAESLRTWAPSFAVDATTQQRAKANLRLCEIIGRHAQESRAFSTLMTREGWYEAGRMALGK